MRERKTSWFWSLLTIQASVGGLNALLPLYVLQLGGSLIDIGNIAAVGNIAVIPGALTWGTLADRYGKRRPIILSTFSGMSLVFLLMYLAQSLSGLILLYALFGFLSAATSPIVNLLLMETFPKSAWTRMLARASQFITLGFMFGTLPGIFWTSRLNLPLREYLLFCMVLAMSAAVLALRLLPEPPVTFERAVVPASPSSLLLRLLSIPVLFVKVPSLNDFKSFWKMIRSGVASELPLLYVVMFLFFTSASMFFTQYPALLRTRGLPEDDVFLAFFFVSLVNSLSFPIAGRVAQSAGETRVAFTAMALRVLAILTGAIISAFSGTTLLLATLPVFLLMGVSFTFFSTSNSTLLFKLLRGEKQGELLGVYSAMTGIGLFLGSLTSGYASFNYGFFVTFSISGSLLLLALIAFYRFAKVASGSLALRTAA